MAGILVICLILANAYMGRSSSDSSSFPLKAPSHLMARKVLLGRELSVDEGALTPRSHDEGAVDHEAREAAHASSHRRSVDRSVIGGGVILGSLATTFLVAVFCYIRATRRSKIDDAPSSPGSPTITESSKLGAPVAV